MRKKIFYSLFFLALIVLALATSFFLWISYRQTTEENIQSLKNQAQLLLVLDEQGDFDYSRVYMPHMATGLGLKVAMNENFVLSVDWAMALDKQDNAKWANFYIKMGYLF